MNGLCSRRKGFSANSEPGNLLYYAIQHKDLGTSARCDLHIQEYTIQYVGLSQ